MRERERDGSRRGEGGLFRFGCISITTSFPPSLTCKHSRSVRPVMQQEGPASACMLQHFKEKTQYLMNILYVAAPVVMVTLSCKKTFCGDNLMINNLTMVRHILLS